MSRPNSDGEMSGNSNPGMSHPNSDGEMSGNSNPGMPQPNALEEASGHATRNRIDLVVHNYSNLALLATFLAGVQAQFISMTNGQNENPLDVATNFMFVTGLMSSTITAALAVLSTRWFLDLNEDDSEYLSIQWQRRISRDKYLNFQKALMQKKLLEIQNRSIRPGQAGQSPANVSQAGPSNAQAQETDQSGPSGTNQVPAHSSTKDHKLGQASEGGADLLTAKDIDDIIERLQGELDGDVNGKAPRNLGRLMARECVLSWVLVSPFYVAIVAFGLFCIGIVLFTWKKDQQHIAVRIGTIVIVGVFIFLLLCRCGSHRRKHVIERLDFGDRYRPQPLAQQQSQTSQSAA